MKKFSFLNFGKLHSKFLLRSILVLVVGVVGFEAMTFYQMSELVRGLALNNTRNTVNEISSKIDDEFARLTSDLEIIGGLPALESYFLNLGYGLTQEATEQKKSLISFFDKQSKRNPAYLAFRICDSGFQQISMYSPDKSIEKALSKTNCNPLKVKTPTHSFAKELTTQKPLLTIRKLISRNEQILGVVELNFDLTAYFKLVENYSIDSSGFLSILDGQSKVLSSQNKNRIKLASLATKYESDRSHKDNMAFSNIHDKNNRKILLYKSKLSKLDWSVYAFVYQDEIFAPLYKQIKFALWLIVSMVFIELIFISFFMRRLISVRINSLLEATIQILKGNYDKRVSEIGDDEITQLSQSFNQMTSSLQTKISEIEVEQSKLATSERQLQGIINNSSAIISIKDIEGRYLLVNSAYCNEFKLPAAKVVGSNDQDLYPAYLANQFRANDQQVIDAKKALQFEENGINKVDNKATYLSVKFPLLNEHNDIYATCGIVTDITERIEREEALHQLNADLSLSNAVLETIIEGVVITDENFKIVDLNPALEHLFGYSRDELIGNKPTIFRSDVHTEEFFDNLYQTLEEHGSWHGEIWEKTKSGKVLPQLLTVTCIRDKSGAITHYSGIYSDISELKQTEAKLQKLAHYDSLTGLANRRLLEERTTQAILSAKRYGHKVAMLFIDLDNFKYINDTLGHDVGDKLLQRLANRFSSIIRETDTLARQGGDEFVILLSKTHDKKDLTRIADNIKAAGSETLIIEGQELMVSCSIGIAVYPDDADSTSGLLKCADMAMYATKESGKNSFLFFTEDLNHVAVDRLKIERALRSAIDAEQLLLYYQPIIDAQTSQVIKVEALLRWPQSDGHFIPPDLFIPIAEESGLIMRLGEWVLKQALKDLPSLQATYGSPIKMSINLSARQFRHYKLAQKLHKIVIENKVSPAKIEFEITEGLLVDDYRLAQRILNELKVLGFSIALDDFGTGYSSLSYLKHFPLDTLKLDKTFMQDLSQEKRNQAIVSASITMGIALGMEIVCEGVETKEQYQFLSAAGNVGIQGYYFSQPLACDKMKHFLSNHRNQLVNDDQ